MPPLYQSVALASRAVNCAHAETARATFFLLDVATYTDTTAGEGAMRELWALRARVRAYVLRQGVWSSEADDVVQEVMIGAWRAMLAGRYCPPPGRSDSLRRWVYGIAWRAASNERRARSRWRLAQAAALEPMFEATTPEEQVSAAESATRAARRRSHLLFRRIDGVVCRALRSHLKRSGCAVSARKD